MHVPNLIVLHCISAQYKHSMRKSMIIPHHWLYLEWRTHQLERILRRIRWLGGLNYFHLASWEHTFTTNKQRFLSIHHIAQISNFNCFLFTLDIKLYWLIQRTSQIVTSSMRLPACCRPDHLVAWVKQPRPSPAMASSSSSAPGSSTSTTTTSGLAKKFVGKEKTKAYNEFQVEYLARNPFVKGKGFQKLCMCAMLEPLQKQSELIVPREWPKWVSNQRKAICMKCLLCTSRATAKKNLRLNAQVSRAEPSNQRAIPKCTYCKQLYVLHSSLFCTIHCGKLRLMARGQMTQF